MIFRKWTIPSESTIKRTSNCSERHVVNVIIPNNKISLSTCMLPMEDIWYFGYFLTIWAFLSKKLTGHCNSHRTIRLRLNEEKLFHLIFTTYQNYPLALKGKSWKLPFFSQNVHFMKNEKHEICYTNMIMLPLKQHQTVINPKFLAIFIRFLEPSVLPFHFGWTNFCTQTLSKWNFCGLLFVQSLWQSGISTFSAQLKCNSRFS